MTSYNTPEQYDENIPTWCGNNTGYSDKITEQSLKYHRFIHTKPCILNKIHYYNFASVYTYISNHHNKINSNFELTLHSS